VRLAVAALATAGIAAGVGLGLAARSSAPRQTEAPPRLQVVVPPAPEPAPPIAPPKRPLEEAVAQSPPHKGGRDRTRPRSPGLRTQPEPSRPPTPVRPYIDL